MPLIYNGTTITAITYNGTPLTTLIYNGTTVWTSSYTRGMYYGGLTYIFSGKDLLYTFYNTCTRIDSNGAQVGSQTGVGTARSSPGGASVGSYGVYYGGGALNTISGGWLNYNTCTRIDSNGAQVGSQTNVGTARNGPGGASVGSYGVYYGGGIFTPTSSTFLNTCTRIDSNGAQVGSETGVGTARSSPGGASVGSYGVYYGGYYTSTGTYTYYNTCTRIDSNGAQVGSETGVGTARNGLGGASVGSYGVYYGGLYYNGSNIYYNTCTRIDSNGAQVGSETGVGTARSSPGGASVGSYGVYYGGENFFTFYNTCTRIDSNGAQVGSETGVGTARNGLGGAST